MTANQRTGHVSAQIAKLGHQNKVEDVKRALNAGMVVNLLNEIKQPRHVHQTEKRCGNGEDASRIASGNKLPHTKAQDKKDKERIAQDLMGGGDGLKLCDMTLDKGMKAEAAGGVLTRIMSLKSLLLSEKEADEMKEKEDSKTDFNSSGRSLRTEYYNDDEHEPMEKHYDEDDSDLEATVLIAQFSNQVLPGMYGLEKGAVKLERGEYKVEQSTWGDALKTLRSTHYMTAMFYTPSIRFSRTLRYLTACRIILLGLFIDSLIYGIYFPGNSTCPRYTNRNSCVSETSKVRTDHIFLKYLAS